MIRTWPRGLVPYVIDDNLPPLTRKRLQVAIDRWNDSGVPVTLQRRTGRDTSHLIFESGRVPSSQRGWLGEEAHQVITLSRDARYGVIMHEIGHAVGLTHEHNRPDRDDHIDVVLANIQPVVLSQFQRRHDESVPRRDYDYGSIMHYSQMAYSTNKQPTIRIRNELPSGVLVGQRRRLSEGDIQALHELYDDEAKTFSA